MSHTSAARLATAIAAAPRPPFSVDRSRLAIALDVAAPSGVMFPSTAFQGAAFGLPCHGASGSIGRAGSTRASTG